MKTKFTFFLCRFTLSIIFTTPPLVHLLIMQIFLMLRKGNIAIVKELLNNGANIKARTEIG